jgi:hypothetical protein
MTATQLRCRRYLKQTRSTLAIAEFFREYPQFTDCEFTFTGRSVAIFAKEPKLGIADRPATHEVQRAVMGDPEEPGAERGGLLQFVQGDKGAGEGVLHHILAVDHRAHQARSSGEAQA